MVALWGVQTELDVVPALELVSVQPVSVQRPSAWFQYAQQVVRVGLWFPVLQRLGLV